MRHYLRFIPNLISLIRISLVIPIVLNLLAGKYILALILFAIASASDAIGTKRSAINGANKINLFTKTSKTISYIILNLNVSSYSRVLEFTICLSVSIFWLRQLRTR